MPSRSICVLEPAAVAAPDRAVHRDHAGRHRDEPLCSADDRTTRAFCPVMITSTPRRAVRFPGRPVWRDPHRRVAMSGSLRGWRRACRPHRRRAARRARPRAARGRHHAARAGVRARRRRHRQDPGDHPRIAYGVLGGVYVPPAGARRHLHRPGRRRDARPGCATSAPAACRPAPSTPPPCGSCTTSGRGSSAATCRGSSSTRPGWSPRRPAGCGWPPTAPRSATSPPRSSGSRSP